ncbi:PAS domain-containing protein [Bradyrhizobium sp. CCBAU 45394]|uniref:PAS domain-containing protein n=1 Tax=Bradyrhizobium sp. CCBAU 45394 TaxID=1325087 RepID=UPI002304CBED|nr:PAS domain-containing protein [Bradyrhizobium sp. CCBAU 45394]
MRELAVLDAASVGALSSPARTLRGSGRRFSRTSPHPYLLLDPGPGLQIVDVNAAYAVVTFTSRADILGRSLFEVFPDDPDQPFADGVTNLYNSLKTVAQTGRPHAMAVQRYDIKDTAGSFVECHWQPINTPVHDDGGQLVFLLHHVGDVTGQIVHGAEGSDGRDWSAAK